MNEVEIALKISSKLEYLMKTKKIKGIDIAKTIPMTKENFSFHKNELKRGKIPNGRFLIAITIFFNENFLN
ncbi:MAG: hypothetical protein ACRC6K_04495 [Fusobacteriaceae bacterium]